MVILLVAVAWHAQRGCLRAEIGWTQRDVLHQSFRWLTGENTITSRPHSKIIYSLFGPVFISARLYSSMRLEERRGKKSQQVLLPSTNGKRFSSTFPLPVKKCCFLASFELKLGMFFPLVFSGRAPFFLANNGNSGAPRRCATVGDLPDCFGHLWISSIKMTAVFHKNAEFGAGTERAR